MEKLVLFFYLATIVIAPLFAISVVFRIVELIKKRRSWNALDAVNIMTCIILPWNLIDFWQKKPEIFLEALWPSGLSIAGPVLLIVALTVICKKYVMVEAPKLTMVYSYCFMLALAYIDAIYHLGILNMIGITLLLVVISTVLISWKPIISEYRIRELRKTLEGERQSILHKEELKYKRLKTQKLKELQAEYRGFHSEDYDKYHRYSKNKNYSRPLINGEELIRWRLLVIGNELRQRDWYN